MHSLVFSQQVLDFTEDVASFESFMESVRASGGGDTPEDVLGGINKAAGLSWPPNAGTRILFHIADAPAHGERFYGGSDDSYPNGHAEDKVQFQSTYLLKPLVHLLTLF